MYIHHDTAEKMESDQSQKDLSSVSFSVRFSFGGSSIPAHVTVDTQHGSAEPMAFIQPQNALSSVTKSWRFSSNWSTLENQPLNDQSLQHLFQNCIPVIDVPGFLSSSECQKLMAIAVTHQAGWYAGVDPPVGRIGITQFEHQQDKEAYFSQTQEAASLQERFLKEVDIDIMGRVCEALQRVVSVPVRIAREGDRDYFAGLIRISKGSLGLIHADYGPYDGPEWEIGQITAQLTWNILLKQVSGGEAIVFDRPWQGKSDNETFKKPGSYSYSPSVVEGRPFKVVSRQEGSLSIFNSRNFHEVKPLDKPKEEERFTISSFIGLLPEGAPNGPAIILWS